MARSVQSPGPASRERKRPSDARRVRGPDAVLALQRMAGNAAVGQLIARQSVDDVKASRRAVVISEGERGQRVKFKFKLAVRGQIPKGNDTLDKIVGSTEADNVRKKSRALETEFIAKDWDLFRLGPDGLQKRMKELGVKATLEFEPFDVAVKDADALPSIDVMRFNAKLEWFVGGVVAELEVSASLSPMVVLGAADRKLLEQFEKKVKELRKEVLDLDGEEKKLKAAREEAKRAQGAADDAAKRATKDIPAKADKGLDQVRGQLDGARQRRKAADEALDAARKQRDQAFRQLDDLAKKDWEAYKRQSKQLLARHDDEIKALSRKAADLRSLERDLENTVEKHGRRVKSAQFDQANKALRKARKAEEALERGVKQRLGKVRQLAKDMGSIASKGKSWVFKKIVGPRMIKVLGMITKFIPFVNIISWAADLYEIGKLLWNWDKLKFGIGGGDGGAGGSGSGGKADPSGKGSGTGTPGTTNAPGQGGGTGKDPWDHTQPPPPAGTGSGTPPPGGVTKPDPAGKSPTGSGTKPDGTGTGAPPPQGPKVDPSPGGGQPGQGNDPTGTQDTPGGTGQTGGTGTTTGTGTTGTGTVGGGQGGGGQKPPKKPGKPPVKPGKGGKDQPGGKGGKGGKGQDTTQDPPKKPEAKPKPKRLVYLRAIPIGQAAADDTDVFKPGSTPEIAKFTGLNKWTAGKNGGPTHDVVHLNVEHDGQLYRVTGVPIRVTGRSEDVPANTPDRDEYSINLRMEVTKTLRLQGTKLVINAGDELHYTWEGSY